MAWLTENFLVDKKMNHLHIEKKGLRGLAVAESFRQEDKISTLAGVVMRRDFIIDGFVFGHATIEGNDATDSILQMHQKLHRDDISFLMISGLIISMYNIVDIKKICNKITIPVIGVTYEDSRGIEDAIKFHFPDSYQSKIKEYHNLGERTKISLHTGHDLYVRIEGCTTQETKNLLDAFTLQGSIPEPLRIAQMLARTKL
ncbi:Uncharacterised protein [uncultured archaeon]|nr:Uncharacterised protein [uncultured archaeon]